MSASPSSADTHALAVELAALIGQQAVAPLLDASQAAALFNVPASWLLAQARAGRVPHVRVGRYVRFQRDELLAWADSRQTGPRGRRDRS
jgi:excisionase family DNA binding protein